MIPACGPPNSLSP
ncbi:hypothetical protein YPPY76_4410, partial [Yersinia pestis PY-76]